MGHLKVLLIYANTQMEPLVPLGVACVYTVLKEAGFEVKIFDTTLYRSDSENNSQAARAGSLQVKPVDYASVGVIGKETNPVDDFVKMVDGFKPDLIGLSCVELTYRQGLNLLGAVQERRIPVIVGGCFATFSPEIILQDDRVDMVCTGEGEEVILALARRMAKKESIDDIPGLWLKKSSGEMVRNRVGELVDVNSTILPKFDGFAPERIYRAMDGVIYRMVPIEISRGCPYQCTYCSAPMFQRVFKPAGRWLRYKTVERIIEEVDYYVKEYDAQYFYFVSETFLAMPDEERKKFYSRYRKYRIPFWFNTRPETVTEYDLKCLEEIGCHRISIGIESGHYELRRRLLKRNYKNDTVLNAVNIVLNTKIQLSVNNMVGFPDETREMFFDTVELNRQFKAHSHSISIFQPFRGTELFDYCVLKGYWDPDKLCADSFATPSLNMTSMSKETIKGLYRTFNLYLNMEKDKWPRIREAEKFDEEGNKAFAELCRGLIQSERTTLVNK
ncbi:MAG: radical SAM protein [Candidatus Omnitrophota bacterium]